MIAFANQCRLALHNLTWPHCRMAYTFVTLRLMDNRHHQCMFAAAPLPITYFHKILHLTLSAIIHHLYGTYILYNYHCIVIAVST